MITFNSFLKESKKTSPIFKKGDFVFLSSTTYPYKWTENERKWSTHDRRKVTEYYGAFCEVMSIEDEDKKTYAVKLVEGSTEMYNARHYTSSGTVSTKKFVMLASEKNMSVDDIDKFKSALETRMYDEDDVVNFKGKTRSTTGKITCVSVNKTRETGILCYNINNLANPVSQRSLENEVVLDEHQEKILAEEIAKHLDITVVSYSNNDSPTFSVLALPLGSLAQGTMYFRSFDEKKKFIEDFKTLVEKNTNADFQKIMNGGLPSELSVSSPDSAVMSVSNGSVKMTYVAQAARNIGINVKEVLLKKRGHTAGKHYDL